MKSSLYPLSIIEVKIGIQNKLGLIKKDLEKIIGTLEYLEANIAMKVRAAAVFQTHIKGCVDDFTIDNLKSKMSTREDKLRAELKEFAMNWPQYEFELVSLQSDNSGYSTTQVFEHPVEDWAIEESGQVTRYYAVIIKSLREEQSNQPAWRRHSNR